jgi:TonB-dependent receptor
LDRARERSKAAPENANRFRRRPAARAIVAGYFLESIPAAGFHSPPPTATNPNPKRPGLTPAAPKDMNRPPLRSPLIRLTLLALCLFAISPLRAQSPATGILEGRVFDQGRGGYLEKAQVTIEGSKLETLTDSTGQYRFFNVPAGTVQVKVFFTGLPSQTGSANVQAGQTAQLDVNFPATGRARSRGAGDVVQLDAFTVSTSKEMEGAAIAINEQRFARNIMQVVSADEFGTIADGSIGEFMKFLPGITSDYTGGDARRFSINGVPEDNVPISMGGFEMASAAGAGTRRAVELDQVSINNIARIEINRAPTPESPGMALAGTVNFVPRSAFERSRPAYSYNLQWMFKDAERDFGKTPGPRWGEWSRKVQPGFDLSTIVPVNKTFGFTLSAGYSIQYTPQPAAGMTWRGAGTATNQLATATPTGTGTWFPDTTTPYATTFNWRDSGKHTTRHSFSTTVDWKPARYDRLSFGFQYGMLKENFATRTQTFTINRVAPLNWSERHTWGMPSTWPTTGTATNAGQITISNGGRIRPGRTIAPSLRWLHDGPTWKSDAGISYGTSRIQYQDIDLGAFNGMTIQRNNLQILFDDMNYMQPGKITVLDHDGRPVDYTDLDSYSLVSANSNRQITYDTVKQVYYNVRRDFMLREVPVSVKVGLDLRNKMRDLRGPGGNLETYTYVGADGRASLNPTTQAGLINDDSPARFIDEAFSLRQPDFGLKRQEQVDNAKLWKDYKANPTHWTRNAATDYSALTRFSRRAEETISAAFVRGDASFLNRRLKLVSGVRVEQTNINAEGPLTDPTGAYQRDANGKVIRNAAGQPQLIVPPTPVTLQYNQLTIHDRGYRAKKEYLRLFPSVNASYDVAANLIARGAYYQTVGRPDFNQYSGGLTLPNTEVVNPADRITVNNVSIKAWQAESYMARLEYYFPNNVGQFSVAYFVRDYENMFGNVTLPVTAEFLSAYDLDEETYGIYQVITQFNVPGTIRTTGVEVDYKQALTFLPHWARGLHFTANYSSQRGKNTFDYFQNMIPFNVNWGLSLSRPKFNLRINENYRGIQRRGAVAVTRGIEPGTYNYRTKRLYVDVSGEYYLKRSLGLFISIRNIGGATEDTKIYGPNTPRYARFRQLDDYSSLWTFGVKGTF